MIQEMSCISLSFCGASIYARTGETFSSQDCNGVVMGGDLSIMVVRGLGKVRRFKASFFLLLASALFLAVFIIFSIFAINEYFAGRRENADLRKQLSALEQGQSQAHQRLYRMQQKVALLESYIRLLEKPSARTKPEAYSEPAEKSPDVPGNPPEVTAREKTAVPDVPGKPPKVTEKEKTPISEEPKKAPALAKQEKGQEQAKQQQEPETEKPLVSVRNVTFQRKNTRLIVSFKLAKTAEDAIPLRGYLHMIIVDKNVTPPQVRTFPHEVLKDGIPVSYKRGQLFVIKHFRVVRGKFFLGGTKQSPTSLRVFVYNKDGVLLLDKELELKKGA